MSDFREFVDDYYRRFVEVLEAFDRAPLRSIPDDHHADGGIGYRQTMQGEAHPLAGFEGRQENHEGFPWLWLTLDLGEHDVIEQNV